MWRWDEGLDTAGESAENGCIQSLQKMQKYL
jgi:hypothetical protein